MPFPLQKRDGHVADSPSHGLSPPASSNVGEGWEVEKGGGGGRARSSNQAAPYVATQGLIFKIIMVKEMVDPNWGMNLMPVNCRKKMCIFKP